MSFWTRRADKNNYAAAELFLRGGADVNLATKNGWTPLLIAADKNHYEVAELLVRGGADVNLATKSGWTPLIEAASNNDPTLARLLLQNGATVDQSTRKNVTALSVALSNQYESVAAIMVRHGAQYAPYFFDRVNEDDIGAVKRLLSAGADPDLPRDDEGNTPLIIAARHGHVVIVDILLQRVHGNIGV